MSVCQVDSQGNIWIANERGEWSIVVREGFMMSNPTLTLKPVPECNHPHCDVEAGLQHTHLDPFTKVAFVVVRHRTYDLITDIEIDIDDLIYLTGPELFTKKMTIKQKLKQLRSKLKD